MGACFRLGGRRRAKPPAALAGDGDFAPAIFCAAKAAHRKITARLLCAKESHRKAQARWMAHRKGYSKASLRKGGAKKGGRATYAVYRHFMRKGVTQKNAG